MRTRHRLRVFLTRIVPLLAALADPRPALAQDACAPEDEGAPGDSVQLVRNPHGGLMAYMFALVAAPSALLLFPEGYCGADQPLNFWRNHVSVYGAGGVAMTGDWRGGTAHSGGIELLVGGVYAEGRVDRYGISDGVRMWDARAGYLIHPAPGMAGGVTVGYREVRDAPEAWTQGGVLIGFPIMIAACSERRPCWLHWEPTYLISDHDLAFSPRLRFDVPVPRTPVVARLEFESRGVRHRDPMALSIGFGLRP